ncbi:hypothetical protein RGAI101_289 [Roseobacter sp. GAI101]|nr:hypothetical protein RGAI101_289 [Roseobacter sp. GAI101]
MRPIPSRSTPAPHQLEAQSARKPIATASFLLPLYCPTNT